MLPADGCALAFALEETEAAGGEEESRVFGIDLEIFAVLGLDGCGGGKGKERTARNAAHEFDCVTWAPSLSVSP